MCVERGEGSWCDLVPIRGFMNVQQLELDDISITWQPENTLSMIY